MMNTINNETMMNVLGGEYKFGNYGDEGSKKWFNVGDQVEIYPMIIHICAIPATITNIRYTDGHYEYYCKCRDANHTDWREIKHIKTS